MVNLREKGKFALLNAKDFQAEFDVCSVSYSSLVLKFINCLVISKKINLTHLFSFEEIYIPYGLPSVHFIVLLLSNLIALKSQPTWNCFAGPELESLSYLKGLLNFRKSHKNEKISQFLPKHCRNFKNTREQFFWNLFISWIFPGWPGDFWRITKHRLIWSHVLRHWWSRT